MRNVTESDIGIVIAVVSVLGIVVVMWVALSK